MTAFLEILKYTIPGLVVFATVYYLFQQYFQHQFRTRQLEQRIESLKITLPLRLQAYERLMLLCDRAMLPNALLRVQTPGMSARMLRGALLVAINQEFQHNTSQQLYVSATLWKILKLAKSETMQWVAQTGSETDPDADGGLLSAILLEKWEALDDQNALLKAMIAIRTEAGELF